MYKCSQGTRGLCTANVIAPPSTGPVHISLFFIYCFYTFPHGHSSSCFIAFSVGDMFCKANFLSKCPTWMAFQKKIILFTGIQKSEIQTNPSPVPLNLSFCLLKVLLVQLNFSWLFMRFLIFCIWSFSNSLVECPIWVASQKRYFSPIYLRFGKIFCS